MAVVDRERKNIGAGPSSLLFEISKYIQQLTPFAVLYLMWVAIRSRRDIRMTEKRYEFLIEELINQHVIADQEVKPSSVKEHPAVVEPFTIAGIKSRRLGLLIQEILADFEALESEQEL